VSAGFTRACAKAAQEERARKQFFMAGLKPPPFRIVDREDLTFVFVFGCGASRREKQKES